MIHILFFVLFWHVYHLLLNCFVSSRFIDDDDDGGGGGSGGGHLIMIIMKWY